MYLNRRRTISKVHNQIPLFFHVATISPCQGTKGLGLGLGLVLGLGKVIPRRMEVLSPSRLSPVRTIHE